MGKYGETAIQAANLLAENKMIDPIEAWRQAADLMFPQSQSARDKNCPRSAFLGLCEEGLIVGVSPGRYTRSIDNKGYALRAVQLLQAKPRLVTDQMRLWRSVMGSDEKAENSQMDVVTALWQRGLIESDT